MLPGAGRPWPAPEHRNVGHVVLLDPGALAVAERLIEQVGLTLAGSKQVEDEVHAIATHPARLTARVR
jgi:hypothetical protein